MLLIASARGTGNISLGTQSGTSISLVWVANSDPNLGGYRIHYGTATHNYTTHLDVGNATTGVVSNLANGTTYFIALTAYNNAGIESEPSTEISYRTQSIAPSPTPTATPHGTATPTPPPHTHTPTPTPGSGHSPTPTPSPSRPPSPTPIPSRQSLLNVATRMYVQTGENVMIGGFIITGNKAKKVIVRALGPSLANSGIVGAMADPVLELHNSRGTLIASNDNWTTRRSEIEATGIPPTDSRESAIVATLQPGSYTGVLQSKTGTPGVALFELYDLDAASSHLVNISTRGRIGIGENVVIGGFIIGGDQPTKVIIRAIGPSLTRSGIANALQDPKLELHGPTGSLIFSNDNWRNSQQQQIVATGIPPTDNRESAIVATLNPGHYTAIVRGAGSATGVGLVEVYNLDN